MSLIVVNGDNLELLKKYPDNYFDAVVTDPPYGLGKEPEAAELMKDWIQNGYHEISGSGFMGKEWDAFVPQPLFWKEVFRVLKHGGHVVAFYGTRTYDWGVMAMRFAGFEVRDCIQWLYGSGFPKSHNIGKAIDKLEGNEREVIGKGLSGSTAKAFNLNEQQREAGTGVIAGEYNLTKGNSAWEGWGSALKPANEPIVLARKPLEKGLSIAENVLKWGTGGINIDGCRISAPDNDGKIWTRGGNGVNARSGSKLAQLIPQLNKDTQLIEPNPNGRFPANIILTHHPECEEIIEDWNCHPDCPIKILDEQSGVLKSTGAVRKKNTDTIPTSIDYKHSKGELSNPYAGEIGGASRFFYVAKASKSERNNGLRNLEVKQTKGGGGTYNEEAGAKYGSIKAAGQNFHPTVKPVKLMQYLVRLVTPPNGIVLDPFCGSGTTGVACKLEGFQFVGMEQDPEYAKIAEARIKNYKEEKEEPLQETKQEDGKDKVKKYIQANLFN